MPAKEESLKFRIMQNQNLESAFEKETKKLKKP